MSDVIKGSLLYEGKAKKVFSSSESDQVILEFKDSLTAFNAQKKGSFAGKGVVNLEITRLLFGKLEENGIPTHFIRSLSATEVLAYKVDIIPLEVVVRNRIAGSLAKKFALPEGEKLKTPLVEFYYKKDELNDPFVSDEQAVVFGFADSQTLTEIKKVVLQINEILVSTFAKTGLILVDFKVEFGRTAGGQLILADEISPDCMRLWDEKTLQKMDKDVFRRDLGDVQSVYEQVLMRLKTVIEGF